MADKTVVIPQHSLKPFKIVKWKVKEGNSISIGCVILLYKLDEDDTKDNLKLKSTQAGTVHRVVAQEGDVVKFGEPLLEIQPCIHPTVMKDMCAECGADLRKDDLVTTASVPMIHSVPELKVSVELAKKLGKADSDRLLKDRKLVLLVDLDQTLIHTTNDNIPANLKDVYHFQLYGCNSPWYHTRLRPGTHRFLSNMSSLFELHICTFGARNYAHTIAMFLDQDGQLFSQRILSRDECFNPTSKTANLKALFPCGDNMVCIIDDREDVWSYASNLIHVKPYHFFQHTGDINAPPGLDKHEDDDKEGVDLTQVNFKPKSVKINGSTKDELQVYNLPENDMSVDHNEVCGRNSDKDDSGKEINEKYIINAENNDTANCEAIHEKMETNECDEKISEITSNNILEECSEVDGTPMNMEEKNQIKECKTIVKIDEFKMIENNKENKTQIMQNELNMNNILKSKAIKQSENNINTHVEKNIGNLDLNRFNNVDKNICSKMNEDKKLIEIEKNTSQLSECLNEEKSLHAEKSENEEVKESNKHNIANYEEISQKNYNLNDEKIKDLKVADKEFEGKTNETTNVMNLEEIVDLKDVFDPIIDKKNETSIDLSGEIKDRKDVLDLNLDKKNETTNYMNAEEIKGRKYEASIDLNEEIKDRKNVLDTNLDKKNETNYTNEKKKKDIRAVLDPNLDKKIETTEYIKTQEVKATKFVDTNPDKNNETTNYMIAEEIKDTKDVLDPNFVKKNESTKYMNAEEIKDIKICVDLDVNKENKTTNDINAEEIKDTKVLDSNVIKYMHVEEIKDTMDVSNFDKKNESTNSLNAEAIEEGKDVLDSNHEEINDTNIMNTDIKNQKSNIQQNHDECNKNATTNNLNAEEIKQKDYVEQPDKVMKNESSKEELIEIEDPDDYLMYLEDILKSIHKAFYENYDKLESGDVPDLKKVIPAVRWNILKGAKLVFSGLVPTHIKLEQSKAYQVARSLGAVVTQDLEEDTTHLVAVRPGTAKVNVGRRKKTLKIVTPDWLWACAERWQRVEEKLFPLNNKGSKNRHPPPHCSSPEHIPNFENTEPGTVRKRTPSGRFMDTINPLMSFSSADIADMDKEVEDMFNESESDGESSAKKQHDAVLTEAILLSELKQKLKETDDESSSSEESLTGEHPHGWKPSSASRKRSREEQDMEDESTADEFPSTKFRRGEELSSDLDIGQESNSEGSVDAPDEIDDGDWNMMGAALEREFLSNN